MGPRTGGKGLRPHARLKAAMLPTQSTWDPELVGKGSVHMLDSKQQCYQRRVHGTPNWWERAPSTCSTQSSNATNAEYMGPRTGGKGLRPHARLKAAMLP